MSLEYLGPTDTSKSVATKDMTGGGGAGVGMPGGSAGQVQYHDGALTPGLAGASKLTIGSTGSPELLTDTPAAPPAGEIALHNREYIGRPSLGILMPNGELRTMQVSMGRNRVAYAQAASGLTVLHTQGVGIISSAGSSRAWAATSVVTRLRRMGVTTAATAGSVAYSIGQGLMISAGTGSIDGSGFFYVQRFVPADPATVAGARMFIGLSNVTANPTNVEPNTLTQSVGVAQLSTDSTQFYLVYGGTAAQTAIPLGTAVGAPGTLSADAYQLAIYAPATTANTFYVRLRNLRTGVETTTQTVTGTAAQVPVNTVGLAPRLWRTNNATALAVGYDFVSLYIETEY